MEASIVELETGLNAQSTKLADEIRVTETSLLSLKEGYLKVQGALEILAILKTKINEDDETLRAALSDVGAD